MADSAHDPKDKGTKVPPPVDPAQDDPTPYIRTYAEDVARMTHQPLPQPKPKPTKDDDGVTLPEVDESPVNRPGGFIRDVKEEHLIVSKDDSDGIFAKRVPPPPAPRPVSQPQPARPTPPPPPRPQPVPPPQPPRSTPPAPPAAVPPPKPPPPIPVAPVVPAPKTDAERREEVLARLRQKVAAGPAVPPPQPPRSTPPAPPSPPPPPPIKMPEHNYVAPPAPLFVPPPPRQLTSPPPPPEFKAAPPPRPQPMPPPPPRPAPPPPVPPPAPPPPPIPQAAPPPPPPVPPAPKPPAVPPGIIQPQKPGAPAGPEPFHSYTTDFADRISKEQASSFTVLAAQQDARTGEPNVVVKKKRSSLVPAIIAVLLIIGGAGGLFAAYRYVSTTQVADDTLGVPSLIFADEKMELSGPDYRQALADAAAQPLVEGNILVTYLTSASSTPLGVRNTPLPGGALIRELDLGAPDILLRNVDLSSTVGIVAAGGQTHPFFVLRVNSYERTFAGMLGWESRMLSNLDPLYPAYEDPFPSTPTATTTASTSLPLPPVSVPGPRAFVDVVVANHDARALKDTAGRTLIIYGYVDKQTLVIARDEAAFTTLAARLAATRGQ